MVVPGLPDATTLLLSLCWMLSWKMVPSLFESHLAARRRGKRETSEDIEQAMLSGMFEVEPPNLTQAKERVEGRGFRKFASGLINALAAEALRSEMAAKSKNG